MGNSLTKKEKDERFIFNIIESLDTNILLFICNQFCDDDSAIKFLTCQTTLYKLIDKYVFKIGKSIIKGFGKH